MTAENSKNHSKPKLLQRVKRIMITRNYSPRTINAYVNWMKQYIRFHNVKHPVNMGEEEVTRFLSWLAVERKVSPSTQKQALNAIIFLYKHVLHQSLDWLNSFQRARPVNRLPAVLSKREVNAILNQTTGI